MPPAKNAAPKLGGVGLAMRGEIPRRPLGRTGLEVSIIGVGGYHLGTVASEYEAARIVNVALDHGVTFFDNAWEYHDGKSETWMGKALAGRREEVVLMTKVCTHGRGADVALWMLEQSLKRLGTDYLDVWQVHEVIYDDEPARSYAADGVLRALDDAKQSGKVRFAGFTGHKDPAIHLDMLSRGYRFDTCQMPINVFDATFRSFQQRVLPVCEERGIGIIGMKCLGGEGEAVKAGVISADEGIRYALSQPVAVQILGIDSLDVLHQDLNIAGGFTPMSEAEQVALIDRVKKAAADGRYELFKTSKQYDGDPGREQHGFDGSDKLPA